MQKPCVRWQEEDFDARDKSVVLVRDVKYLQECVRQRFASFQPTHGRFGIELNKISGVLYRLAQSSCLDDSNAGLNAGEVVSLLRCVLNSIEANRCNEKHNKQLLIHRDAPAKYTGNMLVYMCSIYTILALNNRVAEPVYNDHSLIQCITWMKLVGESATYIDWTDDKETGECEIWNEFRRMEVRCATLLTHSSTEKAPHFESSDTNLWVEFDKELKTFGCSTRTLALFAAISGCVRRCRLSALRLQEALRHVLPVPQDAKQVFHEAADSLLKATEYEIKTRSDGDRLRQRLGKRAQALALNCYSNEFGAYINGTGDFVSVEDATRMLVPGMAYETVSESADKARHATVDTMMVDLFTSAILCQLHVAWQVNYNFDLLGTYVIFDSDWNRSAGIVKRTASCAPVVVNTGAPNYWCVVRHESSRPDSILCATAHGSNVIAAVCQWLAVVMDMHEGVLPCGANITPLYIDVFSLNSRA